MELQDYLLSMVEKKASDLYLITGAPPSLKINGVIHPITEESLPIGRAQELVYAELSDEQIRLFEETHELNLAISKKDIGRFRVNIYRQRGQTALVLRHIKSQIPSMESLNLPSLLSTLVMQKRGLILIVGATGTGKSTTLASMINYRNQNTAGHIVTIEDPIEYIYRHNKSIVTQREIGVDTESYEIALKNTLRQAPDVILIGEIRDQNTMHHAISFSETGHLCLSTLHATNANQALERVVHFFPEDRREQLLLDLSMNLTAIISQRLIPTIKGGIIPAFEILLATPFVRDLIKRSEINTLRDAMEKGADLGMQTFDSHLFKLYLDGKISAQEALKQAESQNNLRIAIQMQAKESGIDSKDLEGLTIIPKNEREYLKF